MNSIPLLSLIVLCVFSKGNFMWGASTASYQIEGGVESRGKNICDSYHRWEEDLNLLKELGVDYYRFSISWSRIFPTKNYTTPDPVGVKYYNDLIDGCYRRGFYPLVTLYHWDLPEYLDWLNQEEIVEYFTMYARTCFQKFGNRVIYWLTFNEPLSFSVGGFGSGNAAPGRCSNRSICPEGNSSTEPYLVSHNALLAHASAYRMYEKEFKSSQGGLIGITLNLDNLLPYRANETKDVDAAERGNEFRLAWYADPIYFGDYPDVMKKNVGSRLPSFTKEESEMVKGTADFFALNHYTTMYAIDTSEEEEEYQQLLSPKEEEDWFTDQQLVTTYNDIYGDPIGPQAASDWLYVYPKGFRETMNWVSNRYNNPKIVVTENGVDAPGEDHEPLDKILNDTFRQTYIKEYLEQLVLAKEVDQVDVIGYFCWSILDNFEWGDGYSKKFGITYVDRSNDLKRIKKDSFHLYKDLIKILGERFESSHDVEKK